MQVALPPWQSMAAQSRFRPKGQPLQVPLALARPPLQVPLALARPPLQVPLAPLCIIKIRLVT